MSLIMGLGPSTIDPIMLGMGTQDCRYLYLLELLLIQEISLVSFPDSTRKEGKGLVYTCTSSDVWGTHDAACYVIGMTKHGCGMAAHKPLSCASRGWLPAWCHMIIICKPHGMNLIDATEFM